MWKSTCTLRSRILLDVLVLLDLLDALVLLDLLDVLVLPEGLINPNSNC
jgi:hypothetical protein